MKSMTIAKETLLLLSRDKFFVPAIIIGILTTLFAHIASEWGIEEFLKIFMDVSYSGFFLTGSFMALFWGSKAIQDGRNEGSLEIQLAFPMARSTWLLGRWMGLCLFLSLVGFLLISILQMNMLFFGYGWMDPKYLWMFAFMILSWWILASLALLFASYSSPGVALFSSLGFFIVGLTSGNVAESIPTQTPIWAKLTTQALAEYWNLNVFNLSYLNIYESQLPDFSNLLSRIYYGVSLILFFLCTSFLGFETKEWTK